MACFYARSSWTRHLRDICEKHDLDDFEKQNKRWDPELEERSRWWMCMDPNKNSRWHLAHLDIALDESEQWAKVRSEQQVSRCSLTAFCSNEFVSDLISRTVSFTSLRRVTSRFEWTAPVGRWLVTLVWRLVTFCCRSVNTCLKLHVIDGGTKMTRCFSYA